MSTIVPAILPKSREDLLDKLSQLAHIASSVQIDLVDGRFVSPAAWPYTEDAHPSAASSLKALFSDDGMLPYLDTLHYEMDLMVSDPEDATGIWIEAGAMRVTVHVESTKSLPKVISDLQVKYGHAKNFIPNLLSLGLAIHIDTDISLIEPYLESTDYVQFMGIATIGKQAQPFDSRVLRKIESFRKKYPDMTIQVDGGVSLETAPTLLRAGVDRLIVGSGIWRAPDIAAEIKKFESLVLEYGGYS